MNDTPKRVANIYKIGYNEKTDRSVRYDITPVGPWRTAETSYCNQPYIEILGRYTETVVVRRPVSIKIFLGITLTIMRKRKDEVERTEWIKETDLHFEIYTTNTPSEGKYERI